MDLVSDFSDGKPNLRHPKIKIWGQKIGKNKNVVLSVYRRREGLIVSDPVLSIEDYGDSGEIVWQDQTEWDNTINEYLLDKGVKCVDPENEGERFAYMLAKSMRPLETKFGDGFFNIAIYDFFTEKMAKESNKIQSILKEIYRGNASINDREECYSMITQIIKKIVNDLVVRLKYLKEEASLILDIAISMYLDERFHVTNRKFLGLE